MSALPTTRYYAVVTTFDNKNEGTRHVCVDADQAGADRIAADTVAKHLRLGHRVVLANGDEQFIRVTAIFGLQPHADGSEVHDYIWHEDGDRVKCERKLITTRGGRVVEEELLSTSWRLEANL